MLLPEPLESESAALIIAEDQYIFRCRNNGRETLKYLSPASVRAAFSHEPIDSGWLPAGVRRWGLGPAGAWAVLVIPAARHRLLFTPEIGGQPSSGRLSLDDVPLPPLVFVGSGSAYSVWAIGTDPFGPAARLYQAPLPNVQAGGQVCFGANQPPDAAHIGDAWHLFMAAPFSQDLCAGKSRAQPADVRVQLRALAGRQRYPARDLVATRQTVAQSVESIVRRNA